MQINDYAAFNFLYEGYKVNDQANKAADDTTTYFGFLNRFGEYFIMRQVVTGTTLAFRFYKGPVGVTYTTAWGGREALQYDTLDVSFK